MRADRAEPIIRVLRGAPDDEELAALTAALLLFARGSRALLRPRPAAWPSGYAPPGAWTTAIPGQPAHTAHPHTKGTP